MRKENRTQNFTIDGKPAMFAVFEPGDFEDLKNGKAVDNNGFRSTKGNYRSRQPKYVELSQKDIEALCDIDRRQETAITEVPAQNYMIDEGHANSGPSTREIVGRELCYALYRDILMPVLKEYVFPILAEKIGESFENAIGCRKKPLKFEEIIVSAEASLPANDETEAEEDHDSHFSVSSYT